MPIPTEPIGSIPRPPELIQALRDFAAGRIDRAQLEAVGARAVRDTVAAFEATGSPVITDGEQTKPSFATYPIDGLSSLAPDGVVIPFADGHQRQLPRLNGRPVPLCERCRCVPQGRQDPDARTGQAGRDHGVGAEPALSRERYTGLFERGVPGGPRR